MRRPEQWVSSSQLSSAGALGGGEHPSAPEELSFKMCVCVFKGLVLLLERIPARKPPTSEVCHRPHSAEVLLRAPSREVLFASQTRGTACASSAHFKVLSPQFIQFCVLHKFSSLSCWVVVDYILFWPCGSWRWGIYCFVPHKMEGSILWTAQPGCQVANFARLRRNYYYYYYYYYYFKEQCCGSVVMLLP